MSSHNTASSPGGWNVDGNPSVHTSSPSTLAGHAPDNRDVQVKAPPMLYDNSGHHTSASPPVNVIVFGESGVGKSSIINMLMGEPVAAVSNQAVGCTYASTKFRATIDDREVMLYDTAGLNEAKAGTVSPEQAVQNLRLLVNDLKTVNLLVYCIRGTRYRKIVGDNYNIFCNTICGGDRKVPVVLVVTGLENEENMDGWWNDNKEDYDEMEFCGHACITATRGRTFKDGSGYIFQDIYDDSKGKVMLLLKNHAFKSSISIALRLPKNTPASMRGASKAPDDDISSSEWREGESQGLLDLLTAPLRYILGSPERKSGRAIGRKEPESI